MARSILPEGATILIKAITMLTSPWVLAGLSCYSVGMVLWLFALRHVDLSLAYPFVAMSFVVVTIMAVVFLGETLAPARIAGLSMIVLGLSVMALWG
ncbi:EamA family transporter [Nioella aestuarii]|uniref:EamA family transporter n=1 Tax=Nioella aestuarii TaxID=1662864 RepID=UPI003D7F2709